MRLVVAALGALLTAAAALAQSPAAPNAAVPALQDPPSAGQPTVPISGPVADCDGRFYADVEFLLRWFKPVCASVPIVTVGNPQAPIPGAIGQPGTVVMVGGVPPHKFEFPGTPGGQLTLGWDRGDGAIGLEVSGFLMAQASNRQQFTADPNGFPNAYLPYQAPDNSFRALPFTIPGVVTGTSEAVGSTRIWGIDADLRAPFMVDRGTYVVRGAFLLGGRYMDLTDRVRVTNTLSLVNDPSAFATGMDQFTTHNQFSGAEVGTTLGVCSGKWSAELTNKLAAGVTYQTRTVEGSPRSVATVSSPLLVPGPLLALPSNIGEDSATRVTLVPEIELKVQRALTSWCSVSLGYSLLYWNKVLCPGDQMSPLVNVTQLPFQGPVTGSLDPKPLFAHTDYFAQGLMAGLEFRY